MMLTPQMRAYFRRLDRRLLLVDVIRDLTTDFGLTPIEAGQAITESVLEEVWRETENQSHAFFTDISKE